MSVAGIEDFIAYWETEGAAYVDHGDYDWMASLVPGRRVLEIGCGVGFGTEALANRGLEVMAMDMLDPCLERTRIRVQGKAEVSFLRADLGSLDPEAEKTIQAYKPDTVVCWLMGVPQDMTHTSEQEASKAVAAYREQMHRKVAELASRLPEVQNVHLVDRTVIPWQAKDLGRDTLVRYHLFKTFVDLPFDAVRQSALYRKLTVEDDSLAEIRRSHPSLKSVVPTLASLLAHRRKST